MISSVIVCGDMTDPLIDSWQINDRINPCLIAGIPASALDVKAPSGERR
jgi:hypothetical protein